MVGGEEEDQHNSKINISEFSTCVSILSKLDTNTIMSGSMALHSSVDNEAPSG